MLFGCPVIAVITARPSISAEDPVNLTSVVPSKHTHPHPHHFHGRHPRGGPHAWTGRGKRSISIACHTAISMQPLFAHPPVGSLLSKGRWRSQAAPHSPVTVNVSLTTGIEVKAGLLAHPCPRHHLAFRAPPGAKHPADKVFQPPG